MFDVCGSYPEYKTHATSTHLRKGALRPRYYVIIIVTLDGYNSALDQSKQEVRHKSPWSQEDAGDG